MALRCARALLWARLPVRALPPVQSRTRDRASEVPARAGGAGVGPGACAGGGEVREEASKRAGGEAWACSGSREPGPGSERGSESIGVSEEGSPPRSEPPLGCARGLCGRRRPCPARWARPGGRGFLFFSSRACGLRCLLRSCFFFPLAAMPCSEDAAAGSVSKRARAEDGSSLRFVRLSEHATAPTRGSARAAGYDLYR